MAIVKKEAKTFQLQYICDACGVGEMRSTGIVLTSMPPKYEHECPNCGVKAQLDTHYPAMQFALVDPVSVATVNYG